MLGSPASGGRRLVVAGAVVAALLVLVVGAIVLRDAQDQGAAARQDRLVPVLLVPGYAGTLSSLEPLQSQLRADGRTAILVPAPGNGTGDLDVQAENLARAAKQAMARTGSRSVDVVGYSAGGVVARLWVRQHGGASVARRVLTIGSPHHGSGLARVVLDGAGGCPPACRELVPGSAFLRRLNAGDETPPGPQFISVWSTSDQISRPPETARLDGALDFTVQSVCPARRTSHGGLPVDPVVLATLRTALGSGPPAAPQDVRCG